MNEKKRGLLRKVVGGLIPLAIVIVSVLIAGRMVSAREAVQRRPAQVTTPLVETLQLSPQAYRLRVPGYGTVQAVRQVSIRPQVSGMVIEQNPELVPGGLLDEGERLLRIDARDYQAALANARADLARAEFQLKLEEGQQVVAQREWSLLHGEDEAGESNRDLALRIPHLAEKKAALEGARAREEKALADLERTELASPFRAQVLSEAVEVGQLVTPQATVAQLVAVDRFRVQVTLPVGRISRIKIPRQPGDEGARATVHTDSGNGDLAREGVVVRLLPDLDLHGRLARVHVEVDDPLGLGGGTPALPLLIGSYVRVDIEGEEIEDAYLIPRKALREGSRIWLVDEDSRLAWRDVDIVGRGEDFVVVRDGLEPGMQLITSALPLAVPGMEVRAEHGDEEVVGLAR